MKKTFPSIKPKSDSVEDIRPSIQSIISFCNKISEQIINIVALSFLLHNTAWPTGKKKRERMAPANILKSKDFFSEWFNSGEEL